MLLAELGTGSTGVIAKVNGHGSFRKRLIEMGFIAGKKVKVVLNAPLQDPIEYEIMGYKLSLRREEARMIEVIGEEEAREYLGKSAGDTAPIPSGEPYAETAIQLEMEDLADKRHRQIRVALVGNPNCGKTSLFNVASGSREHVGNYSGVTVDAKEGKFSWKGFEIVLVDLPGTYSLSAYSPEELYVRRALTDKTPDVVINVVDASNIERNLYLTTQIIDMNLRTVIALNMYDELISKGDEIDTVQLGKLFGVPVCPTISRNGEGIGQLFDTVLEVYKGADPSIARHIHINHGPELEQSIDRIKLMLQRDASLRTKFSTRYLAIKYLEHDSDIEKILETLPFAEELNKARAQEDARIKEVLDTDCESAIVDAKYAFINGALTETYREHRDLRPKRTVTDKIDAVVANKWAAFPIFILLLYIIFQATFTLGQYPMDWIDAGVAWLGDTLGGLMSDGWLKNLVVDGVIAGVGSVLVFLPNILILYFFISLLEDSGYMARAAFIVDKMMHRLGLHGKSFIPMVMGFGCNVPAIMACRTIESRKSRLITISIIPFMACAGRLPIFVLFAGAFFPGNAPLVLLGIYLLGIILAILSAMVIKRFVKDDDLPFVMELPPYRVPTAKAIWRHTWEKGRQYLQKMATTILLCSIVIWFLGYFPRSQELTAATEVYQETFSDADAARVNDLYEQQQANSYIGRLGRAVEPVLAPMGINWKMGVSLLTGVAAKELVVSSLGVMYSQGAKISQGEDLEDDTALQSALALDISWPTALAFMVFVLLYFPCIATFVAIKHETHSWKWAAGTCAYTMLIAWLMSFLTYTIFTAF
ncbi:MAG: ferrous iron transport protein B [Bacteroidales bacterium]|nr:ferrous iron transport protein B [Bacteroidales bacterium]